MIGRTNTGGGGGGGLNFKVVGNPQPSNPKENVIWVNTDVKITGYYFSVEQPENMVNGDVWFPTGTSSSVAFNALKKNAVQVYPISAKQYVNGAWVDKTAKSYQGSKWIDWIFYILQSGKEPKITGMSGVTAAQWSVADGVLTITRSSGQSSAGYTTDVYSFAGKKRLYFTVTANSNTSTQFHVSTCGVSTNESVSIASISGTGVFYVDLSNSPTQGRIRFDFGLGTFKVTDMYLE